MMIYSSKLSTLLIGLAVLAVAQARIGGEYERPSMNRLIQGCNHHRTLPQEDTPVDEDTPVAPAAQPVAAPVALSAGILVAIIDPIFGDGTPVAQPAESPVFQPSGIHDPIIDGPVIDGPIIDGPILDDGTPAAQPVSAPAPQRTGLLTPFIGVGGLGGL